jgi:UPF0716 protein FxsA
LARLLLLLPALFAILELAVLIEVGDAIGTIPTLLLVLAGVVGGALLVKRGGIGALGRARTMLQRGEAPTGPLFDVACLVVAGLLLAFPGLVSDALALPLVIPQSRAALRRWLASKIVVIRPGPARPGVIEGEWRELPDEDRRLPR